MENDVWAILICSSRYWHNYRHLVNIIEIYKLLTINNSINSINHNNIIVFNALAAYCDPKNEFQGLVSIEDDNYIQCKQNFMYNDYKENEVTVKSFYDLLLDNSYNNIKSKRLKSNNNSTVLIYLSGHGGDEFFKFQDNEEMNAYDFANVIELMYSKQRFGKLLIIADTCQALTLSNYLLSKNIKNVYFIGSSLKSQNSYSYSIHSTLGVATIDRFTYQFSKDITYMIKNNKKKRTIRQFIASLNNDFIMSDPLLLTVNANESISIIEFFTPSLNHYNTIEYQNNDLRKSNNWSNLIDYDDFTSDIHLNDIALPGDTIISNNSIDLMIYQFVLIFILLLLIL